MRRQRLTPNRNRNKGQRGSFSNCKIPWIWSEFHVFVSCEQRARIKRLNRKKRLCLQGAITLENTDSEQRALRWVNLSFIKRKRYFAPSQRKLADTSKSSAIGAIAVQPIPTAYSQLSLVRCQSTSCSSTWASVATLRGRSRRFLTRHFQLATRRS